MTFPVWISIGDWRLHPHLVFEALAYGVGFTLFLRRRRARGDHLADGLRWSVVTAAAVGAVIGSRILYWLEGSEGTLGGKTLVGGLLGGWLAVEIEKRRLGIREATGDLFVLPMAVGIAIGRIGCFLSGLPDGTYGVATTMPWGIDFGDDVRRHPTAIYESLLMATLVWPLARLERTLPRGDLFNLFVAVYLAFRLVVDAIKPGVPIALGLTAIQWACVAGLAVLLRRAISHGAKRTVDPSGSASRV